MQDTVHCKNHRSNIWHWVVCEFANAVYIHGQSIYLSPINLVLVQAYHCCHMDRHVYRYKTTSSTYIHTPTDRQADRLGGDKFTVNQKILFTALCLSYTKFKFSQHSCQSWGSCNNTRWHTSVMTFMLVIVTTWSLIIVIITKLCIINRGVLVWKNKPRLCNPHTSVWSGQCNTSHTCS